MSDLQKRMVLAVCSCIMNARALFDRIQSERWELVKEWELTRAKESIHLDFKRAQGDTKRHIGDDDIKNLAKALSGFANTDGGVVVFGIDARPDHEKVDCVRGMVPIESVTRFEEAVRARVRDCAVPPVRGVEVIRIDDPSAPDTGVVVVFVPQSIGVPHRASSARDVSDRYYMRLSTGTVPMPHALLAAMFGQRPHAELRLMVRRKNGGELELWVENIGRGMARTAYLRIQFMRGEKVLKAEPYEQSDMWFRHDLAAEVSGRPLAYYRKQDLLIFPCDRQFVGAFRTLSPNALSDARICGRIDCDGSPPVEFDALLPVPGTELLLPVDPA